MLGLLFAGFSLLACGGAPPGATGPGGSPQPSGAGGIGTEQGLEQAARDSFAAFLAADDQTYFDLLSEACRDRLGYAAVESYLVGRRTRATRVGGINLSQVTVADVAISDFNGDRGRVSLTLTGSADPFRESEPHQWQYEDGGWHLADCADISASPNDLTGRGTDRNEPLAVGEIVDIDGWLVSLAFVSEDFAAAMGDDVEAPAAGNQLVGAQLLVTYNGADPTVVIGEHMTFAMVADSTVFGDESECRSDQPGLLYDPTMEASPGDSLPRPLICREVPAGTVGQLLLRLTHTATGTEYWFEL